MVQVQYHDTRPVYEQIKQSILILIRTDAIREREKLPSVRELAEALGLHPNMIQRVYQELEEEGYLHKKRGCGTFCATKEEIREHQKKEQENKFDESVETLLSLSVDVEMLKKRIDEIVTGRKQA